MELEHANRAISAAIVQARQMDIRISVAVCDDGGHPVAFARMDGAGWAASYGAVGKATASAATGSPSGRIPPDLHVMQRINELAGDRMIFSQGAVPIVVNGKRVGAIGAGGGTAEQDEACAAAGAAAIMDPPGT
ncbi:MAG: heme-binding protein [Proteobacteria bacterium]|nr:heme-binding protein [Pseudomonadota bacterium]MYJ95774.1 heme-binding protein [Pseudomonadota bacterium]